MVAGLVVTGGAALSAARGSAGSSLAALWSGATETMLDVPGCYSRRHLVVANEACQNIVRAFVLGQVRHSKSCAGDLRRRESRLVWRRRRTHRAGGDADVRAYRVRPAGRLALRGAIRVLLVAQLALCCSRRRRERHPVLRRTRPENAEANAKLWGALLEAQPSVAWRGFGVSSARRPGKNHTATSSLSTFVVCVL